MFVEECIAKMERISEEEFLSDGFVQKAIDIIKGQFDMDHKPMLISVPNEIGFPDEEYVDGEMTWVYGPIDKWGNEEQFKYQLENNLIWYDTRISYSSFKGMVDNHGFKFFRYAFDGEIFYKWPVTMI